MNKGEKNESRKNVELCFWRYLKFTIVEFPILLYFQVLLNLSFQVFQNFKNEFITSFKSS